MGENRFVRRAASVARDTAIAEAERAAMLYHSQEELAHFVATMREDVSAITVLSGDQVLVLHQIKRLLWAVVILLVIIALSRA